VLPLPNAAGGHRLGVNSLAVDSANSILYSAGRDGCLCTWDLHLDLQNGTSLDYDAKPNKSPATTFRQQIQAHTHWINDIALAQSGRALVSASSDITVKLWRPAAADGQPPQTIGLHSDYVKTLAVPSATSDWIASGGLDRKICLWDLNGGGQKLAIYVGDDEAHSLLSVEKGSVYALAATNSIIASGGPEKTVRVWDAQSGKRITKLVGHTDNIRDILISQDGTTIMTASSDCTVKVWSTTAGRCMYTLTMHDASVWSLFSNEPDLSVFYSSDRSGLVAKTDTRNVAELDEGLSLSVLQEHEGVHKVVARGGYIWAATSRPSINRWRDVSTDNLEVEVPETMSHFRHRSSATTYASKYGSLSSRRETVYSPPEQSPPPATGKRRIPSKHVLRLTNTGFYPFAATADNESGPTHVRTDSQNHDAPGTQTIRAQPDDSVEGQNGLIKHVMLSDRRRVLTLDTAGEVVMWDLLRCIPVRSYGKRHLEDVKAEETVSMSTVVNWCSVDTRTGSLAVVLEEQTCFDAEMYADELQLGKDVVLKEDARINLGKWVLRNLFANLIDEEVRRDNEFRQNLLAEYERQKLAASPSNPMKIELPPLKINSWRGNASGPSSAATVKASATSGKMPFTPGFGIGLATPAVASPIKTSAALNALSPSVESRTSSEQPAEQTSPRKSGEKEDDYFSTLRAPTADVTSPGGTSVFAATPMEGPDGTAPTAENGGQEVIKEGLFGKKFLKSMSFSGMKKLGRTQTSETKAVVEEKIEGDATSEKGSNKDADRTKNKDTLQGLIAKIHHTYEESLLHQVQNQQARENGMPIPDAPIELPSMITPPPPDETPELVPPPNTTILIQEDRPEAGGVADLFEGRVSNLVEQISHVELAAPLWLGDLLLKNLLPFKEINKISFILEPWQDLLPPISGSGGAVAGTSEGANRLNANRMLRARKILAYVAERIEPQEQWQPGAMSSAEINMMRPEEYMELWCQDKVRLPRSWTLSNVC
jgi:WD repeat-containing protein 48